ncbi:hypothetical protein NHP190012_09950 [Helicobacter sp. NHP19-012]|uniref:Nif11 domain-containing protein n=1 Tax=Helicobacter gastrofelis TaxID=2849642 RepID=A0ABM7SEX9_9HELI|nr:MULTISPECIES: hypothetical protein [unclassified Helicobacter]BCZ19353.1 hypothetical protein NHP190012_09950 [Helicobacter sp. NHP19-012]GMB96830.1 hypothetical protein NHP22001_14190 [Helicobacter sp. NHP22-001]
MAETFENFSVAEALNTDERRTAHLNAVLEDGDFEEIKDALAVIAESKGVELPPFEGEAWFLEVIKKLGFGLQALEAKKCQSA